jgi:hypothetical protein
VMHRLATLSIFWMYSTLTGASKESGYELN